MLGWGLGNSGVMLGWGLGNRGVMLGWGLGIRGVLPSGYIYGGRREREPRQVRETALLLAALLLSTLCCALSSLCSRTVCDISGGSSG